MDNNELNRNIIACSRRITKQTEVHDGVTEFYCDIDYHFAIRRLPAICDRLYHRAIKMTYGKTEKLFYASVPKLVELYGYSDRQIRQGLHDLEEVGFFEVVRKGGPDFTSTTYRVVTHKEWAAGHPDSCCEKRVRVDRGDNDDPLGELLWVAGGRFEPYQIRNVIRPEAQKQGLSDEQVQAMFIEYANANTNKQPKSRGYIFGFLKRLRGEV